MPRWRWLNRLYALINGYYWLPCPICGRNFGGHEGGTAALMTTYGSGISICSLPACLAETYRRNLIMFRSPEYKRFSDEFYLHRGHVPPNVP